MGGKERCLRNAKWRCACVTFVCCHGARDGLLFSSPNRPFDRLDTLQRKTTRTGRPEPSNQVTLLAHSGQVAGRLQALAFFLRSNQGPSPAPALLPCSRASLSSSRKPQDRQVQVIDLAVNPSFYSARPITLVRFSLARTSRVVPHLVRCTSSSPSLLRTHLWTLSLVGFYLA